MSKRHHSYFLTTPPTLPPPPQPNLKKSLIVGQVQCDDVRPLYLSRVLGWHGLRHEPLWSRRMTGMPGWLLDCPQTHGRMTTQWQLTALIKLHRREIGPDHQRNKMQEQEAERGGQLKKKNSQDFTIIISWSCNLFFKHDSFTLKKKFGMSIKITNRSFSGLVFCLFTKQLKPLI